MIIFWVTVIKLLTGYSGCKLGLKEEKRLL